MFLREISFSETAKLAMAQRHGRQTRHKLLVQLSGGSLPGFLIWTNNFIDYRKAWSWFFIYVLNYPSKETLYLTFYILNIFENKFSTPRFWNIFLKMLHLLKISYLP